MKDKAGRTIKPGDIVIYGKSLGRSSGMQYGKVISIFEGPAPYSYGSRDKMEEKLRFIGIDDGWGFKKALQKPSTLSFSERILVVTRKQVNAGALKLLDTIDEKDQEGKMTFEDEQAERIRKLEARIEELEKEQLGQQVADEKVKYWQGEIERVERNDDLTRKLLHAAERRVSELEGRVPQHLERVRSYIAQQVQELMAEDPERAFYRSELVHFIRGIDVRKA